MNGEKVDAIVCVAGGWAGGNAGSKDLVKNADMMWKQSVWSSVIASHLAAKHLKENGLLVLTGAHPALQGTAGKCHIVELCVKKLSLVKLFFSQV